MNLKKRAATFSEINVTPLVDVMLVLLIIFMITAPFMQQNIPVHLPSTKASQNSSSHEPLVVSIVDEYTIYIGTKKVGLPHLVRELKTKDKMDIVIAADQKVSYGFVAKILGELKFAGFQKVSLATEPL